jgi:two pore calcium channel protein 1/two pore calcium channel protein 3
MMICYSKDLRRTLLGILKTSKDLIILFILYFVVISMFAFIGINLLPSDINMIDKNVMDYSDFFKLFFMLFTLGTLDFYPDM